MGKKQRTLGATLLSATFLMSLAPGAAQAAESSTIYMNPNAGITKLWKTDPAKYGNPVSPEKCVKGKGCEQVFEKSVITWNSRNGVKALTGAERAQAFEKAGGIATVGALEGDAWNNSYCGPSVTTFDGKTRHLVVVGGDKATIGSSIDLNSDAGKQWLKERATTKECFGSAPDATDPADPTVNLDWSKATYDSNQGALVLLANGTAYVTQADANGKRIPNAPFYEVKWLTDLDSQWYSTYWRASYSPLNSVGYPVADAVTNGDIVTQKFSKGSVTWNTKTNSFDTFLTVAGATKQAQSMAKSADMYLGNPTGNFTTLDNGLMVEDFETAVWVYDPSSGIIVAMDGRVYKQFIAHPESFGTVNFSYTIGDGRGGEQYNFIVTDFRTDDSHGQEAVGIKTQSASVSPYTLEQQADGTYRQIYGTSFVLGEEPVWIPTDPAKVDWSQAFYFELPGLPNEEGGALFYQDGPASSIIIKANADGTPKAGATAYRSDWLGYFQPKSGRFDYNDFSGWYDYTPSGDVAPQAFLGVPVEDGKTVVENGITYQVQRFEHGSIKWEVPVGDAAAKDAVVTLDAETQKIYDARLG